MNRLKRFSALIIAIFIFALSLPTITAFAADPDMRYGRTKLSSNEQKVYDRLVTGCASDTPTKIEFDESWGITADQLHKAFKMFYSDYPEYFWVENGGYGWSTMGNTVVSFVPSYCFSNASSAKSAYNSKVDELINGLSGKSDYEKAKILHDRLIDKVDYTTSANDQNAYGALVEGKAVCNGYARAYQHLMNKVGIPAWYVRGESTNPNSENAPTERHAWNVVKIDGSWYYTDVTWDDPGSLTYYAYFNITKAQLDEEHVVDSDIASLLPSATATAANYFVKENKVFSSFDKAKLVNLLKNASNHSVQIYVSGNTKQFDTALQQNFQAIMTETSASGASVGQLGRARIITVTIVETGHKHSAKSSIKQKDASCVSTGTKAHYICDCGLKFLDAACTQQVTSESQLIIQKTAHTPSNYKSDNVHHWKECTKCGTETANTNANHTDGNGDNKCDTCGYGLPVKDESGNTVVETPTPPPSNDTPTEDTPTVDTPPIDDTPTTDNPSTETPTQDNSTPTESQNSTENPSSTTVAPSSQTEAVETTEHIESEKSSSLKWIIIGGAAILFIGAGLAIVFINKKKA